MPNTGNVSICGNLLEWKWTEGSKERIWESRNNDDWMFLWSPKYKAIVSIKTPDRMVEVNSKSGKIPNADGAAKATRRFKGRKASKAYKVTIPDVKVKKLGKSDHIIYRSDKWNPGKNVNYIHDFKNGVEIHCGPSLRNPQVFICYGGKLTLTERGLVF